MYSGGVTLPLNNPYPEFSYSELSNVGNNATLRYIMNAVHDMVNENGVFSFLNSLFEVDERFTQQVVIKLLMNKFFEMANNPVPFFEMLQQEKFIKLAQIYGREEFSGKIKNLMD